jgi:hypothetical protein
LGLTDFPFVPEKGWWWSEPLLGVPVFQVLGKLNKAHRSSKQSVDLLEVELYTPTDWSGPDGSSSRP